MRHGTTTAVPRPAEASALTQHPRTHLPHSPTSIHALRESTHTCPRDRQTRAKLHFAAVVVLYRGLRTDAQTSGAS